MSDEQIVGDYIYDRLTKEWAAALVGVEAKLEEDVKGPWEITGVLSAYSEGDIKTMEQYYKSLSGED
jgi:hypothetical protein